jgi:hypothetical protein
MWKLNIFISHSSQDKHKAKRLGNSITIALGRRHDIFLAARLKPGGNWLKEINEFLARRKRITTLVLATPDAIKSPWVWFEIGASSRAKTTIIPICDGDMKIEDLPDPLARYTAIKLDKEGLVELLKELAGKANASLNPDRLELATDHLFPPKAKLKS